MITTSHKPWLSFVKKAIDVSLGYSREDLSRFRDIAYHDNPAMLELIDAYRRLLERSELPYQLELLNEKVSKRSARQMHLFDLLRERTFFPQNLDLAQFASRVMPSMRAYRYDKMSRSDIAARIIEYIEGTDPKGRDKLEASMRSALAAMKRRPPRRSERETFLETWEKIIKGTKL